MVESTEEVAELEARLKELLMTLPEDLRSALPTDDRGQPRVEVVRALFRYDNPAPREFKFIEVREMNEKEWDRVLAAHRDVNRLTRGLDNFPLFAWGDLEAARHELLRQLRTQPRPQEWMPQLIEYRLMVFSTSLKMYHEHVLAEVKRTAGTEAQRAVDQAFADCYDASLGYRVVYSLRNAFLHGVRGLVTLKASARLVPGTDDEIDSEAEAPLDMNLFSQSRANAAVRAELTKLEHAVDLFELSADAYTALRELHLLLTPILHARAPNAAALLAQYIREVGNDRAYFHEYIRGLPTKGLLGTTTLDQAGFEYVAQQTGRAVDWGEITRQTPHDVLPSYPARPSR